MAQLKAVWDTTKSSISATQVQQMVRQQLRRSDPTELQGQSTRFRSANISDTTLVGSIETIKTNVLKGSYRNCTKGWRFGAISCACSASVVFLINFIVTIYGSVHNGGANPGLLFEGDCGRVENLNTGLHLLINALSTILLGSSNYCMQCLSAPTRSEVDAAHAKGTWLDIGIPSVRNLPRIARQRVILWLLLGFSSLPLHLFYNSAVFSSISSNNYYALSVSQSFIDSAECHNCAVDQGFTYSTGSNDQVTRWLSSAFVAQSGGTSQITELHAKARNGELERLEPAECIYQYAQTIQSDRRNVLLVANDDAFSAQDAYLPDSNIYGSWDFIASTALGTTALDSYSWVCSALNNPKQKSCESLLDAIDPANWQMGCMVNGGACGNVTDRYPVQYCLSEKAEPHCKLQFSLPIAILVTVLNFFKAVMIFYIAYTIVEDPLITMGDAVASFLEAEDSTTKPTLGSPRQQNLKEASRYLTGPNEWKGEKLRWKDSTSTKRRVVTFSMFLAAIVTVSSLLGNGIASLPDQQSKSLPALAKLGFGAVNPMITIQWGIAGMIPNTLMANLAQPILSFLYFSYNSVFTAMLLGREWCSYSYQRKSLRLSSRVLRGNQRSTYFLQLPYRFAFPLMILSGILHWFVSRSIFLVAIDFYGDKGTVYQDAKVCGYSPIAIISTLILGSVMVLAMIAIGYVPYRSGISLAGSCSVAMSAACHVEWAGMDGYDAAKEKLKWGVVGESPDGVGYCSFSSGDVKPLQNGKVYAGFGRRRKVKQEEPKHVQDNSVRQKEPEPTPLLPHNSLPLPPASLIKEGWYI